jgi:hypothetical protein
MRRFMGLASMVTVVVVLGGCSDPVNDLFQNGQSGGAGGTPSTAAHTGTSVTSATTATTNATNGTTTTTVQSVASVSTTASVAATTSSGPQGPFVGCGGTVQCDVQDSVCCFDSKSKNGMCAPASTCHQTSTAMPTAIACQGPSDCQSGKACCAVRYFHLDTQPYEFTQCQSQCDLPDRVVCDPANPVCPIYVVQGQQVQSTCKMSTLLPPGYNVCSF